MVRRTLSLLGIVAAVLILGFVALYALGGGGTPTVTAGFPTTTTIAATRSAVSTSTTIVSLQGIVPQGPSKRQVLVYVVEPNVVGMTLAQAGPVLSTAGLSYEISTPTAARAGTSSTGTILAEVPAAGSKVDQERFIQLTVSGY
jgi:beta-lactam-binding protein with PASTA domain